MKETIDENVQLRAQLAQAESQINDLKKVFHPFRKIFENLFLDFIWGYRAGAGPALLPAVCRSTEP